MCEDQHAPRSPATNFNTRSPIAKHSIRVYCQNLHKFHSNATYHGLIRKGAENRLKELFAKVAKRARVKIHVRWTSDVKAQKVSNRDIVIYFVKDFDTGLIRPYLQTAMRRTTGADRRGYVAAWNTITGNKEAGLTFVERSAGKLWTICEVYIDLCFASVPQQTGATNYKTQLETWTGRMMAQTAFHEAMHMKVDPWSGGRNIHGMGGGGLADPSVAYGTKETRQNITVMANAIKRLRRPYILGKSPTFKKTTPKMAPAKKAPARRKPRLDTTLDPNKLF